jgi:hypothetical protein
VGGEGGIPCWEALELIGAGKPRAGRPGEDSAPEDKQ